MCRFVAHVQVSTHGPDLSTGAGVLASHSNAVILPPGGRHLSGEGILHQLGDGISHLSGEVFLQPLGEDISHLSCEEVSHLTVEDV